MSQNRYYQQWFDGIVYKHLSGEAVEQEMKPEELEPDVEPKPQVAQLYRKKPVALFAIQFNEETRWNTGGLEHFLQNAEWAFSDYDQEILLKTYGDVVKVQLGDWIIRDIDGELYPCKDSVFQQTYDAV